MKLVLLETGHSAAKEGQETLHTAVRRGKTEKEKGPKVAVPEMQQGRLRRCCIVAQNWLCRQWKRKLTAMERQER